MPLVRFVHTVKPLPRILGLPRRALILPSRTAKAGKKLPPSAVLARRFHEAFVRGGVCVLKATLGSRVRDDCLPRGNQERNTAKEQRVPHVCLVFYVSAC